MNLDKYRLWTALVTPARDNLEVDFTGLELLLREQESADVGALLLGSTGEALNLGLEIKKEILKFALSLKLKIPLMVGVGGHDLQETTAWIKYLETLPVHAYLLVTPIYAKPGAMGQTHWFKRLMDTTRRPCVLYNVPSRAGTSLSLEAVEKLSGHPNFWGIKEASGKVEDFKKYKLAAKGKLMFSGDDALLFDFAKSGVDGLISVASNIWPDKVKNLTTSAVAGNIIPPAKDEQWKKASNALFCCSNPVPVKRLLFELQKISSPCTFPPLSEKDLNHVEVLAMANKIMEAF